MKLSKPQLDLLKQIKEKDTRVVEYYKPGQALLKKGLATNITPAKYGGITLSITERGKIELENQQP
jgi:hypothetical protein